MKFLYVWHDGDCLLKIAQKFNTTVDSICKLNGITNVDVIKKGDMIQIPSNGEVTK